jgi:hypothetical protein
MPRECSHGCRPPDAGQRTGERVAVTKDAHMMMENHCAESLSGSSVKKLQSLREDAARLTATSLMQDKESSSAAVEQVVARLEADLSRLRVDQESALAAPVGEDEEMAAALADALRKSQTAHKTLISRSARLETQLRHLGERSQRDRSHLEQVHQTLSQAMASDSLAHALFLTNEALIAELRETRSLRDAAQSELSELSLRLRCARAIADAMAAMDAGATREAAARSALLQLEEEMQDELRQSQVLTRDLEAQLEAAKARLSRMVQLRQALDARAAGAAM